MTGLFRLGESENPWTQDQIDEFMERMEMETFDSRHRGVEGSITRITREDAQGNETTYVKEDGEWSEEE